VAVAAPVRLGDGDVEQVHCSGRELPGALGARRGLPVVSDAFEQRRGRDTRLLEHERRRVHRVLRDCGQQVLDAGLVRAGAAGELQRRRHDLSHPRRKPIPHAGGF
jgi:hypothetical protein